MVEKATKVVSGTVSSDLDGTHCSNYFMFQFVDRILLPAGLSFTYVPTDFQRSRKVLLPYAHQFYTSYRAVEWTLQFHTVELDEKIIYIRTQIRPAIEFVSGEEGLLPKSYYLVFSFVEFVFADAQNYVMDPGSSCGAEGSWRDSAAGGHSFYRDPVCSQSAPCNLTVVHP